MKARPSMEVKGTPRRAIRRKDWKPDGPRGLGGVRVRTLSNSRYSMGAGRIPEFQSFKLLKSGEKESWKCGGLSGAGVGVLWENGELSGAGNRENMPRRRGGGMGWETENVILKRRRGDSGDRRGEQRERKNERGDSGGMSPSVRRGRVAGENTVSPVETFRQFVAAINRHDVGAPAALMTPDHVFVDSRGNRAQGAASMEVGWRGYFTMCPDYWIRVDRSEEHTSELQ